MYIEYKSELIASNIFIVIFYEVFTENMFSVNRSIMHLNTLNHNTRQTSRIILQSSHYILVAANELFVYTLFTRAQFYMRILIEDVLFQNY